MTIFFVGIVDVYKFTTVIVAGGCFIFGGISFIEITDKLCGACLQTRHFKHSYLNRSKQLKVVLLSIFAFSTLSVNCFSCVCSVIIIQHIKHVRQGEQSTMSPSAPQVSPPGTHKSQLY